MKKNKVFLGKVRWFFKQEISYHLKSSFHQTKQEPSKQRKKDRDRFSNRWALNQDVEFA